MKKNLLVSLCVIMASLSLNAQDIIVTTSSQKIEAKILEVSKNEIKYKEKDNLDGPSFILETSEISSIIYANGKVVLYNQQASTTPATKTQEVQAAPTILQNKENASSLPIVDESTAEILLLSGYTITAQITEMKSNYVAFIANGKPCTMPASQIDKVTFLQNGQVKYYSNTSAEDTYSASTVNENVEKTNTETQSTQTQYKSHYQAYIEFSGFTGKNGDITDGGIGVDIINGVRINKYLFMGLGVGSYDDFASYRGFTIITSQANVFTDVRAYIPTKQEGLYPYVGTSIGPMVSFYQGLYGNGQSITMNEISVWAFFRINVGIDVKRFTAGLGYELWADKNEKSNYFFFKLGVRLGNIQ